MRHKVLGQLLKRFFENRFARARGEPSVRGAAAVVGGNGRVIVGRFAAIPRNALAGIDTLLPGNKKANHARHRGVGCNRGTE